MTYLRKKELADMLRVSIRSVSNYMSEGYIPQPIKMGRVLLWKKEDVEVFLKQNTDTSLVIENKPIQISKRGRPRKILVN